MTVIGITLSKKAHTNVVTHINLQRNSSGENMNRCYEILELNNEIQKRLYSILSDTSRDGKSVPCLITNYTHFACGIFSNSGSFCKCSHHFLLYFLMFLMYFLDDCIETIRRCPMSSMCCTPSRCDSLIQVCKILVLRE